MSDDYIAWLKQGLTKAGKNQSDLARYLGYDPSTVSRMLSGERRLKADEISKIADFFGLTPYGPEQQNHPQAVQPAAVIQGRVPVVGIISPGRWDDPGAASYGVPAVAAVIDERWPIEDQSAYVLDAFPIASSRLQRGDKLITVQFSKYRVRPISGDNLVRKRIRGGLISYQLLSCTSEGLVDVVTGERADEDGELIGLVVSVSRNLL